MENSAQRIRILVSFVACAALLAALAPLPYGYYMAMRIVVAISAMLLMADGRSPSGLWQIAFVAILIVFNPIVPLHLTRTIWRVFNLAGAMTFAAYAAMLMQRARREADAAKSRP